MRYYKIVVSDPDTGAIIRTWNSYPNGQNDPGALNVEMDIAVAPFATPMGGCFLRIWGIGITDINQSYDFNFKKIDIYGGMQKGLPLAKPLQSGLLISGKIQQAFGNWQGVNMTLDFIITAGTAKIDEQKNIVVNWAAGTKLKDAVDATLKTAFPELQRSINISDKLVLAHDESGFYGTLGQFGKYLKQVSQPIIGGNYQGVDCVIRDNGFIVYDGTSSTDPLVLDFNDLIGQATWLEAGKITFSLVMRADLYVNDFIKLPPGQIVTTQQSYSQYRQKSIFQGVFQIDALRHVGSFRAAEGEAWITTVQCHPFNKGSS